MSRRLLALLIGLLLAASAVPALAQSTAVRIREATLAEDGSTEIVVSVDGGDQTVLAGDAFAVSENGADVSGLTVEPLLESRAQPVGVALAIDISGSTAGEPLENAKLAATAFLDTMVADDVRVGLVAFGGSAELRSPFTSDADAVRAAIGRLEAAGETALYDGVLLAVDELAKMDLQRNLVIFSDGADTVSATTLADVVTAAKAAGVQVTVVGLATPDFDPASLDAIARETGGRFLAVDDASLLSASFEQVAQQLASQYVLTYRSTLTDPDEIELTVSVAVADATVSDAVVVTNNRVPPPPQPRPAEVERPSLPFLATRTGLYGGTAAAFLAMTLLLGVALSAPLSRRAERTMRQGLRAYSDRIPGRRDGGLDRKEITRRAVDVVANLPKPEGFEERLQARIEQAGWPMRASEFLLLQVSVAIVAAATTLALAGSWIGGAVALVVGWFAPRAVLDRRVSQRQAEFLEQLPDTLQLLSGSLRAGYGLLQAIDTVVQEAAEPTASEFARALTEARLGMPLDDALEAMADRLGSEDFGWVVLAVNIQRQVGGNLAELLETVANTLRERSQVRRQIKTLSAEGRLSAVVLVALPFFLAVYMFFVNPDYMGLLFTRMIGIAMVVGALVLMALGILWMRKLIDIEV